MPNSYKDTDFIGFTWDGVHSSTWNLYRVSNGSRYSDTLIPEFTDYTAKVPGNDWTYYFDRDFTQKPLPLDVAFDSLTEAGYRELRAVFGAKKPVKLIFDELPYKYYMVKVSSPPTFTTICFDEPVSDPDDQTGTVRKVRHYKGEGTINLVAYYPFAKGVYKYLELFDYEIAQECTPTTRDTFYTFNDVTQHYETYELQFQQGRDYYIQEGASYIQVETEGTTPDFSNIYYYQVATEPPTYKPVMDWIESQTTTIYRMNKHNGSESDWAESSELSLSKSALPLLEAERGNLYEKQNNEYVPLDESQYDHLDMNVTYYYKAGYQITEQDQYVPRLYDTFFLEQIELPQQSGGSQTVLRGRVILRNSGDLDVPFKAWVSKPLNSHILPAGTVTIQERGGTDIINSVHFNDLEIPSNEAGVVLDINNNLLQGYIVENEQRYRTSTVYNNKISSETFYNIPPGEWEITFTLDNQALPISNYIGIAIEIEYDNIYY